MKSMQLKTCASLRKFSKSAKVPVRRPPSRSEQLGALATVPKPIDAPPTPKSFAGLRAWKTKLCGAVRSALSTSSRGNVTRLSSTSAPAAFKRSRASGSITSMPISRSTLSAVSWMLSISSVDKRSSGGNGSFERRFGLWASLSAAADWPERPPRRRSARPCRWSVVVGSAMSLLSAIIAKRRVLGDLVGEPGLEAPDLRHETVCRVTGKHPGMAVGNLEVEGLNEASERDLLAREGSDGHRHAAPLDRRLLGEDVAVEGQPVGELDPLDAGRLEPDPPVLLGGVDIEQLVTPEVLGPGQRILAFEEIGRADRGEERGEERAIMMRRRPVAGQDQAAIDMGLVEIPVEISGRQLDLHVGKPPLEVVEPRDQPFERHRDIDLDGQGIVGLAGPEQPGLGLDLVEGIANRRVIEMAGLRQERAPGVAVEQLETEHLLQDPNLVAHRRAGDAELVGRHAEAAEPRRRLESGQRAERRQQASGQFSSPPGIAVRPIAQQVSCRLAVKQRHGGEKNSTIIEQAGTSRRRSRRENSNPKQEV